MIIKIHSRQLLVRDDEQLPAIFMLFLQRMTESVYRKMIYCL